MVSITIFDHINNKTFKEYFLNMFNNQSLITAIKAPNTSTLGTPGTLGTLGTLSTLVTYFLIVPVLF